MTAHHTATVLSIGDELVLGQTVDTNTAWIAGELGACGVRVLRHETLDDDATAIADAIARAVETSDTAILTGGLGPTADDLTRHALALAMNAELVLDERALDALRARYTAAEREMPATNEIQAARPAGAAFIENPHGTAPGLAATIAYDGLPAGSCDVFCLPGPPREMKPMFIERVMPRLRPPPRGPVVTRLLRTFGLGESDLAQRLGRLMDRDRDPLVGTTASAGVVTVRIRSERARDPDQARADVAAAADRVREILGGYVFAEGDATLSSALIDALKSRDMRITTAESCTGGLVASEITSVAGSSAIFDGALICYANAAKSRDLRVDPSLIEREGAVSADVAAAMAGAALEHQRADLAVAITGIAGPDGGTPDKPVGTVWIAVAGAGFVDTRRFVFPGERGDVRRRATTAALGLARLHAVGEPDLEVLWQHERR